MRWYGSGSEPRLNEVLHRPRCCRVVRLEVVFHVRSQGLRCERCHFLVTCHLRSNMRLWEGNLLFRLKTGVTYPPELRREGSERRGGPTGLPKCKAHTAKCLAMSEPTPRYHIELLECLT